jgi:hypothetical protein
MKKKHSCLRNIKRIFFQDEEFFELYTEEDYNRAFGIRNIPHKNKYKDGILEKAYERAWKNRDFEIDKFWTRAAYFWGFIVLIFGGYISIVTSNSANITALHLDWYLLLVGLIFSVAWLLVLFGSKAWQENWENHIDWLENNISCPLYRTIYYKRKNKYYSVSKINIVLAWLIIVVWITLIIEYIILNKCKFLNSMPMYIISGVIVSLFLFSLIFGYPSKRYKIAKFSKKEVEGENEKKEFFIDRWEGWSKDDLKTRDQNE